MTDLLCMVHTMLLSPCIEQHLCTNEVETMMRAVHIVVVVVVVVVGGGGGGAAGRQDGGAWIDEMCGTTLDASSARR